MADLSGFDANNVEPNEGFDVLPAGDYEVAIVSSNKKRTKAGNAEYLALELQVLNGQFQNRKLFDRLNIWNPSQQAANIAKGTLSAICRAVGVMTPSDSAQLHNKAMLCRVKLEKDKEGNPQNVVASYKPRQGGGGQQQQPQQPQQQSSNSW